ncbi:MAG: FdhF/YdeP family oxidoreductase [Nitrospinaceae bacterium]
MKAKIPRSAGGWGALWYSLKTSRRAGGLIPMMRALFTRNSCKSCALGMGGQRGGMRDEKGTFPSVCNKSIVAQASDMQGAVPGDFFERYDVETLGHWDPRRLELSGRFTQPLICEANSRHYRPISWEQAIDRVVEELKITPADKIFFYASGRSSNEAGFLLQLFARTFGTNNVNNCSYYCHQASGVSLSQSLGTGTATLQLDDLDAADLVFLMGANPASNHPRFMTLLMNVRRRGGKVIVINPARERGLENFSVPSDLRSLLFGSEIASTYIQPNIAGDIPLLKGIAKSLFNLSESDPETVDRFFIDNHTENFVAFRADIEQSSWEDLEEQSGLPRSVMEDAARQYAGARNVVFAWAMGITHHAHGVDNVQAIVNLALLRGMVGRKDAGLLPLRGHSNVQGMGSIGFTPALKKAVFENLESMYSLSLPTEKGLDTLGCMEGAREGRFRFAWNLGGNLYGSNPDSLFAEEALANTDFILYMNTTPNQGHFKGRGKTTLILPVLARDEEPEPTTQESMFSYIRLSDGGKARHKGPRSEVSVIAEIASRTLSSNPLPWKDLQRTESIRKLIGSVVPGFGKLKEIDQTREEFHIEGRILHTPRFPTANGKARFRVCKSSPAGTSKREKNQFKLMTVRSEGQFNTVVYDMDDRYRGVSSRDIVFMNPEDAREAGFQEGGRVTVKNPTGRMSAQRIVHYPIKTGNIMMYYPETNVLVPRVVDPDSKTPSFKSVDVIVESEN